MIVSITTRPASITLVFENIPVDGLLEKQDQLRKLHERTGKGIRFRHATFYLLKPDLVNHITLDKESSHHLRRLQCGNEWRNPRRCLDLEQCKELVKVHDGMNSAVHDHKGLATGCVSFHRVPTLQEDRCMMKPV